MTQERKSSIGGKSVRRQDLRLTMVAYLGRMATMAKKQKNSEPPPKQPERMRACHRFTEKLERAIPHGKLVSTFVDAKVPGARGKLGRWRKGSIIQLDQAFLVARHLGLSLDWLADDERTEGLPLGPKEMTPGVATKTKADPPPKPSRSRAKRGARHD
jgi:hypothetical protein